MLTIIQNNNYYYYYMPNTIIIIKIVYTIIYNSVPNLLQNNIIYYIAHL